MNLLTDPNVIATLKGSFRLVAPEIALVGTACVVFFFGSFLNKRWLWFVTAFLGVVLAGVLALTVKSEPLPPAMLTVSPVVDDATAAFVRWVAIISAALFVLLSWSEVRHGYAAEYYGCLLVAAAGTSLVGRANDLITLFLSLEMLSIPTYVLLYLPAKSRLNQEAAAKYFLLSVLSSAVLLFGFSYLYGVSGTTNLDAVTRTVADGNKAGVSPLALLAVVLVIAAVGFRVTAVPFHFYAPDVYEGAPTGVVAQLSFLPKVAGFVALARVLGLPADAGSALPFDVSTQVPLLLWILAVVTMSVGNVMALLQDNLKRMLAYSSVAHGGYMLMGLVVATAYVPGGPGADRGTAPTAVGGLDALLVYLAAYGAMTVGAFALILFLSTPDRPVEAVDDVAGLGTTHPVTAGMMAVFLFSLIGLPLTAGFSGKFLLFVGAFNVPADTPMRNLYRVMAVVAAVNAAVGAYYYLRVVGVMYLRTPLRPLTTSRSAPAVIAAVACAGVTLFFGVYPNPLVKAARKAAPVPSAVPLTAAAATNDVPSTR